MTAAESNPPTATTPALSTEEKFDRHYFGGGGKVGGYAREGYWDYPVHETTARHVLARRPESVLELGAARGYLGKRLQDAGVRWAGLEVSKHCYLTRVADPVHLFDLCETVSMDQPGAADSGGLWPFASHVYCNHPPIDQRYPFDLCFSIATLEHVPEDKVPAVIREMARTCKRGLHGIDFGGHDDGFDQTHCTLKPREWWVEQFNTHAPDWPVEIVDKETLEQGGLPPEVLKGDGKVKLNVGSFTTMFHHGWVNLDNHDLRGFAQQHGYVFGQLDVRGGLPFPTGSVDLLFLSHFLDQLTYAEGLAFLRECRRVVKAAGALRIVSCDALHLIHLYNGSTETTKLSSFTDISPEVEEAPTDLRKLWSLLLGGHVAAYDTETLGTLLIEAGWVPYPSSFRQTLQHPNLQQIRRECLDQLPCLSLFMDCLPQIA